MKNGEQTCTDRLLWPLCAPLFQDRVSDAHRSRNSARSGAGLNKAVTALVDALEKVRCQADDRMELSEVLCNRVEERVPSFETGPTNKARSIAAFSLLVASVHNKFMQREIYVTPTNCHGPIWSKPYTLLRSV